MRQVHTLREGGESIASLMTSFTASWATIYRVLQQGADDDADVEQAG